MRWLAVTLLGLCTLWFVALVVAALAVLPALLQGERQGPDDPYVVIAYGCGALLLGGCSVALIGSLVRSPRPGRSPPRWARPLAFSCAGVLLLGAVATFGRPEMIFMGFPALAFAMAGFELPRREAPSRSSRSG